MQSQLSQELESASTEQQKGEAIAKYLLTKTQADIMRTRLNLKGK